MTQEDKELLLKDICARLPYGTLVYAQNAVDWYEDEINTQVLSDAINEDYVIKPYLFPLSSMTEEQKKEQEAHFICIKHDMSFSIYRYMEWCYKNHLDVNGLIGKGLAIDATGKNIY